MSGILPNIEDRETSLASSSQVSEDVPSLDGGELDHIDTNMDSSEQPVPTQNADDSACSESQDMHKSAMSDLNPSAQDSLKSCDEENSVSNIEKTEEFSVNTTIIPPVIPLPPDESAQDASDVVMGTTSTADVQEISSHKTHTLQSDENKDGYTTTAQFVIPQQPEKSQQSSVIEDASEVKGQSESLKSNQDACTADSKDSDSEMTFKIPKLLSESLTKAKEANSEEVSSKESENSTLNVSSEMTEFSEKQDDKKDEKESVTESVGEADVCLDITPQISTAQEKVGPESLPTDSQQSTENGHIAGEDDKAKSDEDDKVKSDDVEGSSDKPDLPETGQETDAVVGDVEMKDDESVVSDTKSTGSKRRNSTGSAADGNSVTAEVEDQSEHHVNADQVFEYQWPPDKTGEYYFLQEQISEYLVVKSFKRKYPDLQRRPVEIQERMFLREKGIVTETQCDLGLTAVRSEEVYDLMLKDYPDKYQDYVQVLQEKERRTISDKHKEYGMPKVDKGKMKEYMKKAIKSAAEFNVHFMRELREERKAYFDLQTFQVMYPTGQMKKLPPEQTEVSAYPVALIPGQFQEYYKKYSPQELKYFPLNTALYDPPKSLTNIYAKPKQEGESDSEESTSSGASLDSVHTSSSESGRRSSASSNNNQDDESSPCCHICSGGPEKNISGEAEELVACSECARSGHPSCLEITDEMIPIIKTYSWQCMECKTCVECMDPYDEDKMMFCDHCDRGYHTFCVGLRSIPTGRWECPSCRPDEPKPKQRRTRTR